jgi:hypothetical protein
MAEEADDWVPVKGAGTPLDAVRTALAKGGAMVVGMPGDIASLYRSGTDWLGEKLIPQDIREKLVAQSQAAQAQAKEQYPELAPMIQSANSRASVFPTTEEVEQEMFRDNPAYSPGSTMGKIGMGAASMGVGTALNPVGALGRFKTAGGLVRDVIPGVTAGGGAEVAEVVSDSPWAKPIGALVGAATPWGARKTMGLVSHDVPGLKQPAASRLAGQLTDETVGAPIQPADPVIPGVSYNLPESVAGTPAHAGASEIATVLDAEAEAARKAANAQAITAHAEQGLAPKVAPETARDMYGQTKEMAEAEAHRVSDLGAGAPTKPEASAGAREVFKDVNDAAYAKQSAAWEVPELQNAQVALGKPVSELTTLKNSLPEAYQKLFPQHVLDDIGSMLERSGGNAVPLDEVQAIRSLVLEDARNAAKDGNFRQAKILNDTADALMRGAEKGAVNGGTQAWKDAISATKEFHDTYRNSLVKQMGRPNSPIAEEATLARVMSGADAETKLNAFLKTMTGTDQQTALSHVGDYLMADLTANGSRQITGDAVTKYLAAKGNLVQKVPGLEDAMRNAANRVDTAQALQASPLAKLVDPNLAPHEAVGKLLTGNKGGLALSEMERFAGTMEPKVGEKFMDGIRRNYVDHVVATSGGDPVKLLAHFDANQGVASRMFTSDAQKQTITDVRETLARLTAVAKGGPGNAERFSHLKKGRFIDAVLGEHAGQVVGGSIGAGLIHGMTGSSPMFDHIGPLVEAIGAAAGVGMEKYVSQVAFPGATNRTMTILKEAAANPEFAKQLQKKATPANWNQFQKAFPAIGTISTGQKGKDDWQ